MSPKAFAFLTSALAVFPLDQLTKYWIVSRIHYAERMEIIPGVFDITHVRNPGGAFSFFADGPFEQRMIFFTVTTMIAIVVLLVFYRNLASQDALSATALGVVLGGALGNLVDRIRLGEVVDFLDVHLPGGYSWPTFNIADSAIVVGVILLLLEAFLPTKEQPDSSDRSDGVRAANSN